MFQRVTAYPDLPHLLEPLFTEHGMTMVALLSLLREVVSGSENSSGRLGAAVSMQPGLGTL